MTGRHFTSGVPPLTEQKLATMAGVVETTEGYPVELWRVGDRHVIRAFNECRNRYTQVEFDGLVAWLSDGPRGILDGHHQTPDGNESDR